MPGPESITTIPELEGRTIESAYLETDGRNGWLRLISEEFDVRVKAEYCGLSEYPLFSPLDGDCVVIEYAPDDDDAEPAAESKTEKKEGGA